MGKQRAASTKKRARQIKSNLKKQGYKNIHIATNPKSLVGKHGTKKYTVVATDK